MEEHELPFDTAISDHDRPTSTSASLPLPPNEETIDPRVAQIIHEIETELGFGIVPNLLRVLLPAPAVLEAVWSAVQAVILSGELPRTYKELIGVVIAGARGSRYVATVHTYGLTTMGVSAEVVATVCSGEVGELTPAQQAGMHYALRTVTEPQLLGKPELHGLRAAGFTDTTLLELCNTIALFSMLCGLADATQVPIDAIE